MTGLDDLADNERHRLPDARKIFEHKAGGSAASGGYVIDNSRLIEQPGIQ